MRRKEIFVIIPNNICKKNDGNRKTALEYHANNYCRQISGEHKNYWENFFK